MLAKFSRFRLLLLFGLAWPMGAHGADEWVEQATISPTTTLEAGRICYTDGRDIACNSASTTTITTSATLQASQFIGDGSQLTGVVASTADRIVSGTTSLLAVSTTGFVSLTQAGTNTGWFDPTRGLVTLGVSTTGTISATRFVGDGSGLTNITGGAITMGIDDLTDAAVVSGSGASSIYLGTNSGASDAGSGNGLNVGLGISALASNTTGNANIAIGYKTLASNTTGYTNNAMGHRALGNNTTGYANTSIGFASLNRNTTGSFNTANGMYALYQNTTSGYNAALGAYAGYGVTGSAISTSVLLGAYAGQGLTTAVSNILVGYNAGGAITTGNNNIVIGTAISPYSNTGNNQLNLGNALFGDLGNASTLQAKLGINVTSPTTALEVSGTVSATRYVGDGSGLTGVIASTADRIVSGTTSMVAGQTTGFVSLTQAGTNTGWFDPTRGLVTLGVSATGGISATSGYFANNVLINNRSTAPGLQIGVSSTATATGRASESVVLQTSNNAYNAEIYARADASNQFGIIVGNLPLLKYSSSGATQFTNYYGAYFRMSPSHTTTLSIDPRPGGINDASYLYRVGVRTEAPSSTFHVVGNAIVTSWTGINFGSNATPTAPLEVNGTVSATRFVGDGSGLTGVVASTADRIVSGTTSMVAGQTTGFVSLTQAGTNTGWFSPTTGLVTLGVSTTGRINAVNLTVNGLIDLVTGTTGVGVGRYALTGGSTINNTALGYAAGQNTTGTQNSFVGMAAGQNNTGGNVTGVGYDTAQYNAGNEITALGVYAAEYNSSTAVTAIGNSAAQYSNNSNFLTAVGYGAGRYNTNTYTSALGYYAAGSNTGTGATAVGSLAGQYNAGTHLNALGHGAGQYNSGSYVVAAGYLAGQQNRGNHVITSGYLAGQYNSGSEVVAIGRSAGEQNGGNYVTALGFLAGRYNSGTEAVLIGDGAGISNRGNLAIGIGTSALQNNSVNLDAIGIGTYAGQNNTGSYVVALGREAARNNTFSNVVALGYNAQPDKANQVVLGNSSIAEVTTTGVILAAGVSTTGTISATRFVGDGSGLTGIAATTPTIGLDDLTDAIVQTSSSSIFIGENSGIAITSGNNNLALGKSALRNTTTGTSNIAMGVNGLRTNTGGSINIAIGNSALYNNTGGNYNSTYGYYSMYSNTTGSNNISMGVQSLYGNTTGSGNVGIGDNIFSHKKFGDNNTAIGYNAALGASGGNTIANSVFVGSRAGFAISSSTGNILVGYNAGGAITTGNNNIVIGTSISPYSNTGDNQLNLGNALFGDLGNASTLQAKLGINVTSPTQALEVSGTISATQLYSSKTLQAGTSLYVDTALGRTVIGSTNTNIALPLMVYATGDASMGLRSTASNSYTGTNLYDYLGNSAASFQYGNPSAAAFTNTFVLATRQASIGFKIYQGGTAAANERLIITSNSAVVVTNANMGVGVISPSAKLEVAGTVSATKFAMGYEQVTNSCDVTTASSCQATCPGSKKPLGGGCSVNSTNGSTATQNAHPTATGWSCYFSGSYTSANVTAHAICANVE